jgi:two-component system CheB/CheR fusion protein
VHNLTSDPPFSKLDLVSCRNVLIYLEPEMQQRLLSLFHFALSPGGHLFLGSAEGVAPLEELFTPISKRRRIFQRLGQGARPPIDLPTVALAATDAGRVGAKGASEPSAATLADQLLLDHFAPAAVVVRSSGQIIRFYGAMDRYITLPKGEATLDVLTLARDALKPTLRAALHEAVRRSRQTVLETLDGGQARGRATLRITVKPLNDRRTVERLWVVLFEEIAPLARAAARKAPRGQVDLVRRLEAELRATKKEQQHLVEQLESSNEELKAANEEVLSMNEELQSTNEELTTSKEELQSMNEELTTLNAQLQDKVHELTDVNDDLGNLLVSTDIATVFLDTDLRIKRFTKAAADLLNLQKSDTGRPLNHIASNLVDVDLARDARTVLDGLVPIEREVGARDGLQYLLRVLPYRSETLAVRGIVLTVVDVSQLKQMERELRATHEDLEARVADRTRWLALMHDVMQAINEAATWDDALHRVLRRICEAERWQIGFVYLPQPGDAGTIAPVVSCFGDERFRPFHDLSMQQTYVHGDRLPGRVWADNAPFWTSDAKEVSAVIPVRAAAATAAGLQSGAAFPIAIQGDVVAVLEIFSNQPHPPHEHLTSLMQNVSDQIGRVLERERATARMADLVWREQQGLLHTLHDSLGQTLTGLGMLSAGLRQRLLATDAGTAETAAEIARQTQLALDQVRRLAKNLFPVDVDAESLLAALRDLASATNSLHKIDVRVDGEFPQTLHDGKIATELYRIAQEAVTNAVKHAQAKTVTIRVEAGSGMMRLIVADDGVGIPRVDPGDGAGLRIMRYRAASIGALLAVERGPTRGTVVTCALRDPPRSAS